MCIGLPPRMRGKVKIGDKDDQARRITPAYAGKSAEVPAAFPRQGDHPRVCGEKCAGEKPDVPVVGSPPRMRGKADHLVCA